MGTTALRIDHYVHTTENVILLGPKDRDQGLTGEATHHTLNYGFGGFKRWMRQLPLIV